MLDILFAIVCVVAIIFLWIMIYDGNRFVVVRHRIVDKRIKKNVRAVCLADLHNKSFGKDNQLLLEAIEKEKPDVILVAGDIPTAKPKEKLDVAVHLLEELAKKYPIYYGNGNHEHRMKIYPDVYGDMAQRYEEKLQEAGVFHLVNEKKAIDDSGIVVYGSEIDRFYYKRFKVQDMEEDYMESILGKNDATEYNILLAHNPDYFPMYAKWNADLVLAGHVHGGMVRIPFVGKGVVSPNVRFFPKYDGGVFEEGTSKMILSRGLGMHTIPVRLFNPGELIVVDFTRE